MEDNEANAPAISKRSFKCPHCGAFSGHDWYQARLAPFMGDGLPPSESIVLTIAHVASDQRDYQIYATKMHHAGLPFTSPHSTGAKGNELLNAAFSRCSACAKLAFWAGESLVFPTTAPRNTAPTEVPAEIGADFNEAGAVLPFSTKASAALSRRCLQALLRDQGFAQKDLANAIQVLLDTKKLPSGLADNVDHIRNVGNFAAHPMKDTNTGAILDVEPHEAEWNLEVLEGLFDFFYVGPAKDAKRLAAYNAKLALAGKPPMKS